MRDRKLRILVAVLAVFWAVGMVPAAAQTDSLRYVTWVDGPSKALEDQVVDMFREQRPEIPVDFATLPGGQGRLIENILVQTAAGVRIDMALSHTHWLQTLIENDMLVDLRPYIQRDGIDMGLFPTGVMESYFGPNGEVWAFPQQWTTIVLAYNLDLFDRHGEEYPGDDWDVIELTNAARRFTRMNGDGEVEQWGLGLQNLPEYVWRLWGVHFTNEDRSESGWNDPRAVEAWSWYADLHREPLINGSYPEWVHGNVAMRFAWPHQLIENGPNMVDAWDIAYHPTGPNGHRVARAAGAQWVILKSSPDPDSAWEFMKFLISQEAQAAFLQTGRGGVQIPAMLDYWVRDFDPIANGLVNPRTLQNPQKIVEAYDYASLDRQPSAWTQILSQVINPMATRLRNQESPAEIEVPEAARVINAMLRE